MIWARNYFNIIKNTAHPFEGSIFNEKAGVKNMPSTKIDFNHNKIARIRDLDELAQLLFPGNRNHQKIFLHLFPTLVSSNMKDTVTDFASILRHGLMMTWF